MFTADGIECICFCEEILLQELVLSNTNDLKLFDGVQNEVCGMLKLEMVFKKITGDMMEIAQS